MIGSARVASFALMATVMTVPSPGQVLHRLPGDGGDALFLVWTMRWVNHAAVHGWTALWRPNIFAGNGLTLAYSDTLLPLAPVFGLLSWLTRSPALAFNLLSVAAWTLSLWATDRLARRVLGSPAASIVAATAFTFSTMRLAQYRHLQLAFGCLLPLALLLLLRLLERPTIRGGLAFGALAATITLIASYYGIALLLCAAVVVTVHQLVERDGGWRAWSKSLAAAASVYLVAIGPVAWQYLRLERDPSFRRAPDPTFFSHWSDFRAVSLDNRFVGHWWPVAGQALTKSGENWLFPGYVTSVLAVLGIFAFARRRALRNGELGVLAAAGGVLLVLSFGSWMTVGGHRIPLPYAALGSLPGLAGIRVPARFTVVPMLVVALLAGLGLASILRRCGRVVVAVVCVAITGAMLLESAIRVETVPIEPTADGAAVNHELSRRPDGVVLELPALSQASGAAWTFVEAPREVASTIDWKPRVNGVSGFEPGPGFGALVATLNRFPAPVSWPVLDRMRVRYVVLRLTIPVDIGERRAEYERPGVGVLSDAEAHGIIASLPADRVRSVARVGSAYLIELVGA